MIYLPNNLGQKLDFIVAKNPFLSSRSLGLHCSDYYFIQSEAIVWRGYVKKVFLEILQNSQENTCARDSFLIKLQVGDSNFEKEPLVQVFSGKFF